MFTLKKEHFPKYTQADWEQWEGKWELIDGIEFALAPALGWYHQELNTNIVSELRAILKDCPNCKANMPVNWKISEKTIVEPDVVVVCKPFEEGIYLTKTP